MLRTDRQPQADLLFPPTHVTCFGHYCSLSLSLSIYVYIYTFFGPLCVCVCVCVCVYVAQKMYTHFDM
jgi:hypothetical protein